MKHLTVITAIAISSILSCSTTCAIAKSSALPINKIDTDNDGTVDLNEVKGSAGALFSNLEKDADGTLDPKELKGRVSRTDMKLVDPDSDGTVSKDELMSYVESLFKDVDTDNDGTIDAKELTSKKGKALLHVTQ